MSVVRRDWWAALLLGLFLLASGCTTFRGPPKQQVLAPAEQQDFNLRVFDRAWGLVKRHFYDPKFGGVDWQSVRAHYRPEAETAADEAALYATLNRMMAELNSSHLQAISPRHAYEGRVHRRAAVGLRFRRLEERWVITEVLPNSPAAEAGVQKGWLIKACNGIPVDEALRKPPLEGQLMKYEFIDQNDGDRVMSLKARMVSVKPAREAHLLRDGVLYVRFDEFAFGSRRWLSEKLKEHRAAPAVIVDLRQNPGGNAVALWLMLGDVFERRVPAGTFVRRSGGEWRTSAWWWFPARYDGRMAVLIDRDSASCSEIFAHVVQHHGRALLIGRKTAGAVILSLFYPLPGGGRLQIAIQDFRGLDGQRLEGNGVTPDREVALTLSDLRAGRDPDVDAALDSLRPAPAASAEVTASVQSP